MTADRSARIMASKVLSSSEALREEIGTNEGWVGAAVREIVSIIRSQLDESAFTEAWEHGQKLTVDEAIALALGEVDEHA